jgi:tRNA pseudouridine38-40 synthase
MTAPTSPEPTNQLTAEPSRTGNDAPLRRFKLTLAYDGTDFHGWQAQNPPGAAALRTVEAVLTEALRQSLRQSIELRGASRTDSGVHAKGQVVAFNAACRIPLDRLASAINRWLPEDALVVGVEPVPMGFDAVRDVVDKQYRYRVYNRRQRPLFQRRFVTHCRQRLDVVPMQRAARLIEGEHDFAGFANAGHGRLTTVRTVHRCEVEPADDEVRIAVSGSGFLYNMVRIIAGTLVEVGRGRLGLDTVKRALDSGERRCAGPTLPAEGLCLEWIRYRPEAEADPAGRTGLAGPEAAESVGSPQSRP